MGKTMRTIALLVLSVCLTQAAPLPRLRVSQNGHFFVKENGSPFFYLGDTSWSLFHLTREDVDLYLKDRAAKKFTVIQAIVAHYGGWRSPTLTDRPSSSTTIPSSPTKSTSSTWITP